MKTLIIGSGGQLGKALSSILENSIPLSHDVIDLRNVNNIENTLDKYSFDTVINCAAMTSVDKCEIEIDSAYYINGLSMKYIGDYCRENNKYLIHVSTDYVFNGNKGNYTEDDISYPINYYGLSKLIGDTYANSYQNSLIIRTSGVYGAKNNFPLYVIDRLRNNSGINAFDNYYSPVNANVLAHSISKLLDLKLTGILNVSGPRLSRYEFALKIADKFGLNKALINKTDYNSVKFIAKRPYDSSLNNEKAKALLKFSFDDIDYNLNEFKKNMDNLI
ncbi:SDR family oxidoreductase [Ferroplasma acidarmanus]|uniref:dTDP-4-dehydrorhamnose reductase n=1 Tax=Ferroplasma acidarmanus Fer1 TaxID=333146 RepID=S0AU62_FERAC|nr:NAD(P)-dependent oxidoreductase [Ferroplasma acidarmanus]AGO61919.1 dTDP-4-dehydrorhamnose reductase [Ferroplasma acidarmanus Fer1]